MNEKKTPELKTVIDGEDFYYDPEKDIFFYDVDKFCMEETEGSYGKS